MPRHSRAFAIILRILAVAIVVAAVVPLVLPAKTAELLPHMGMVLGLIISIGAAGALFALASLMQRENDAPPETTQALVKLSQQVVDLDIKLHDLQTMYDRLSRASMAANSSTSGAKDHTEQLHQLALSIEELRKIALMPDADRRQVSQRQRQQQKTSMVDQLFGLVSAHEWFKAERLLISLEAEFPNDEDVTRGRSYLNHSRNLFEREAVTQTIKEIEELMLTASWDKALDKARQLMQGFPTSGDAHALLARVEREYQIYRETNVQRLFDDIRRDIDHRTWRPALNKARQLIDLFPAHRFAEHMRGQMSTLQNNAEIEERQEIEIRIQEYLRDGKLEQAIDLGEDLMRRFPHSPQADSLETLLPKIRELARQGVSEFSGLSPMINPFHQGNPINPSRQQPTSGA